MIDTLFGSKTRVKLLHLFLNNPGKAFYVREITRLIGEQINSVRRELSNMLDVGIISSHNTNNKLYYEVNRHYEYFTPLQVIFGDTKSAVSVRALTDDSWEDKVKSLSGVRVAIAAGALVKGSASRVDLVIIGDVSQRQVDEVVKYVEQVEGRDLSYSVLSYDEFYYRLSVRDRFVSDVVANKHVVLVDTDQIMDNK